jgi:hypothetical protein
MDGTPNWPQAISIVAVFTMITAVAVTFILGAVASWKARLLAAREDSYRRLAEEANALQRDTQHALERTAAELSELRVRTAELERMLKEVA